MCTAVNARFFCFSQNSPFKRNLSLRLNELPSNLSRQQADFDKPVGENIPIIEGDEELGQHFGS